MRGWFEGWAKPGIDVADIDDIVGQMIFKSARAEARINSMTDDDHKMIFEGNALLQHMSKRSRVSK